MPLMVTVVGYGSRRSTALTQSELNAKPGSGTLVGGCPNCTEGSIAAFEVTTKVNAVLRSTDAVEMYVISFPGADQSAASSNGKDWMEAESGWLNQAGMSIRTFYF